jgi:hypothetical protein
MVHPDTETQPTGFARRLQAACEQLNLSSSSSIETALQAICWPKENGSTLVQEVWQNLSSFNVWTI